MTLNATQLIGFAAGGGQFLIEDCSDITSWTEADVGTGVSSQATFDGESTFKLDTGASTGSSAFRFRAFDLNLNQRTITLRLYNDTLGAVADSDFFAINSGNGTERFIARFATDGLFIVDSGSTNVEVGTNIVSTGVWNVWQFVINFSTPSVDVYKDGVLQGAGFDLLANAGASGLVSITTQSITTVTNCLSYVDSVTVE